MGSRGCIGALAPQFLGIQADGTRLDGKADKAKQPPVASDWHSMSFDESSRPEVEYCFKLVERNDGSDARSSLFGSKDVSQQTRTLELSLCGMSKYGDSNANRDEAKPLVSYPDGLKKDCSYITMEAVDSSNGVKEVRVSFHGLDDSRKADKENESSRSGNHDLAYGDDGCLPLVSQFRALLSAPKLSCGGLFVGDGKHSPFEGLGSIIHSLKTSESTPASTDESVTDTEEQKSPLSAGLSKSSSVGCKESPRRAVFEARDIHARCDALPLAHYRPDCPVWCSKDQEQKRDGGTTAPSGNGNSPIHGNCKKPPKPPKPPRHPGRSTSLDAATLAAAKAAAARKKAMKQAVARRKARVSAPANSGGTPFIALVLTLGFGVLMVFQGLFVQSNATYGDSDKTFVDVPSDQFGEASVEKSISYGLSYHIDPELQSSSEVLDPGKADIVISTALYKSMQELELSRNSQLSGGTAASG